MKVSQEFLRRSGVLAVLLGASAGCGDRSHATLACAVEDMVGGENGVCVGVAEAAVCGVNRCTEGVSCASTIDVKDDGELEAAIASATAGTCISLSPGAYGPASLPGGVSLLGKSAADVAVEGVTLNEGVGAVVRGLTIGAGGLKISGATGAQVISVLIADSAVEGINVAPGSAAKIISSTVRGSSRYGLRVADGAAVTLDTSIIEGSEGPGIWSACSTACAACTAPPKISVTSSIIRDNHVGGVALFTTWATLENVDIRRTKPGAKWHSEMGGGGLSVMSLMGVWVQNVAAPQSVVLTRARIDGNKAVGVGTSGSTRGFIFRRSTVQNTLLQAVPAESGGSPIGSTMVGDGFVWRDNSSVTIEAIEFSNNARTSILVDGPAEGSISSLQLSGGDEQKGIVIQNVTGKDAKPDVDEGAAPLNTSKYETFAIPTAPQRLDTAL
jgi:hypothetical protein